MQTAQAGTLSHHSQGRPVEDLRGVGRALARWLTRVFGCWHTDMSRPATHYKETYRVCLDCGARRRFDPVAWEMIGDYYYSEASAGDLYRLEKPRAQAQGKRARSLRLAA
jgi:hypothetical protein